MHEFYEMNSPKVETLYTLACVLFIVEMAASDSKLNCEVLWDDLAFEVRWAVAGDSIVLQLVSRLENGEYMAFGISGDPTHSKMVGGDVTVAWVDKDTLKGQARDYFLDAKSQCSGERGSCPDENIVDKTNSIRLLNAALVNGYSIVTYQRSLKAQDEFDKPVYINGSQPVIWAIGPLNARQEVSYHSLANRADILIDFGRPPKWNCPTPEGQAVPNNEREPAQTSRPRVQPTTETILETRQQSSNRRESSRPKPPTATPAPTPKVKPWDIPAIQCHEPEDGVFYAQMGPTGGKRGYSAITGHVGWGISWYINGLLIPEINVVRGRTYTFIVEGGHDPETPARYHPFYITDDSVGGYEYKTPEERAQVQIFAGAVQNKRGEVRPTGLGRLCNWTPDPAQPPADEFSSFGAYQRTLRLECDQGEPGIVQWTVPKDAPDTLYYQCYTHRYLGWKINVLDHCEEGAASEPEPVFLRPPTQVEHKVLDMEPEAQPSIQQVSKVLPDSNPNHLAPAPVQFVPEFHFYNKETGEPLDEETMHRMNLEEEIKKLEMQFYLNQPQESQHKPQHQPAPSQHFNSDDQFLTYFHTPKPIQALQENHKPHRNMYSVNESPEDMPGILPGQQFQLTPQTEKPTLVPTARPRPHHFETTTIFDDKFNQDFLKNYHQLQQEAAAKLKKHNHKFNQQFGKPTRLQYGVPRRPPMPHHAVTLQQRPMPPGMFRPPFLPPPPKKGYSKRPTTAASQKVPTFASINNIPNRPPTYMRPQKPPRKETHPPQSQNINFQILALQKLITTMTPHELKQTKPTFATTPVYTEPFQYTTPAVFTGGPSIFSMNTGFNPESVKVEGGFKPILSTGIAPSFKIANDRMDTNMEMMDEAVDDDVGVIDLTKDATTYDLSQDNQEKQGEVENVRLEPQSSTNSTDEEVDIFKHLKPVMFEPMFVPSPPDNLIQKRPFKIRKKPVSQKIYGESLKHRNNNLEPYNTHKNKYIKMRPRPNMIRRPLYPNNVMPPFKIPVRGGSPQFRYQQSDEYVENTTDYDLNRSGNETSDEMEDDGENVLEVIEMEGDRNSSERNSMEVVVLNTDDGQIFDNKFNIENSTEDEIAMADDVKEFYLPPKRLRGSVTYDGKIVSAIAAPTQSEKRSKIDITKIPQFAPFEGDLPPLAQSVPIADLPQLKSTTAARSEIIPDTVASEKTRTVLRPRRSPDHVPGHNGSDHDQYDHDHQDHHNHDHHDHDHEHDHEHHNHNETISSGSNMSTVVNSFAMTIIAIVCRRFL